MDTSAELDKLEALVSDTKIPSEVRDRLKNQINYMRNNVDVQLIDHPRIKPKLIAKSDG